MRAPDELNDAEAGAAQKFEVLAHSEREKGAAFARQVRLHVGGRAALRRLPRGPARRASWPASARNTAAYSSRRRSFTWMSAMWAIRMVASAGGV